MLKALRENFKHLQWILWGVIAIFVIFVFADWGMGSQRGGDEAALAAKAGGIRITTAEFQKEYAFAEDRYRQAYGKNYSPELARAMNLPEQVLNSLIDRRLFREEAERLHLKVTDEELTQHLLGIKDPQSGKPLFVKDGVFVGDATYRRILAANRLAPQSFEDAQREQILLEKLNRFFTEAVVVSDDEVKSEFEKRNVKAKIAWALLPVVSTAQAPATDAEAEAYFKANPTPYMQPEKRKAKYLLVETAKIRPTIQVTDADVAADYAANAETYRKGEEVHARHILYKADAANDAAQKAKAEAAVRKLRGGADFAALAKAESDDPGSKANGGDLGAFPARPHGEGVRGRRLRARRRRRSSAPSRARSDTTSSRSSRRRAKGSSRSSRSRRGSARASRTSARATRPGASRRASPRRSRRWASPPTTTCASSRASGVTFNETEFLSRTDAPAGHRLQPAVQREAVLPQGGRDRGCAGLDAARRGDRQARRDQEARPAGLRRGQGARRRRHPEEEAGRSDARGAQGTRWPTARRSKAVAKKLNLKVETPDAFSMGGPIPGLGSPKAVLDAVFSAKAGEMKGPIAVAERGAVVMRVDSVTPFDQAAFEKEKDAVRESLRGQKSNKLLQALVQKKRSDLKIEFNRELLSRMGGVKGLRKGVESRVIARLSGTVLELRTDRLVLDVGGVGYDLAIPLGTFSALPPAGEKASVHVHMHVREDALPLFGFATTQEKYVFERLISVSGVGPKVALTVLSGLPLPDLVRAIATQNARVLATIPGIGKKLAERLGLELKEKLAGFGAEAASVGGGRKGLGGRRRDRRAREPRLQAGAGRAGRREGRPRRRRRRPEQDPPGRAEVAGAIIDARWTNAFSRACCRRPRRTPRSRSARARSRSSSGSRS